MSIIELPYDPMHPMHIETTASGNYCIRRNSLYLDKTGMWRELRAASSHERKLFEQACVFASKEEAEAAAIAYAEARSYLNP